MRPYGELNAVERLALANGEAPPEIKISRQDALLIITALTNAGQHTLAQKVREGLTWAQ